MTASSDLSLIDNRRQRLTIAANASNAVLASQVMLTQRAPPRTQPSDLA